VARNYFNSNIQYYWQYQYQNGGLTYLKIGYTEESDGVAMTIDLINDGYAMNSIEM